MDFQSKFGEFPGLGSSFPLRWKAVRFERPVVLMGWDVSGQEITANLNTIVVGAKGCVLRAGLNLPFEGRVLLCCNQKEIEGELKFSEPLERNFAADLLGRFQYLVSFDHEDPKFWESTLEPIDAQQRFELECSACRLCTTEQLSEEDELIFVADSVVVLQCPWCKAPTRFTAPQRRLEIAAVEQDPNLVVSGHHVYHMQPSRQGMNERQFGRVPTSAKAYLRIPGKDGDVVNVLDISRGGMRFESMHNYEQGIELEVATHYVEGGNNIFQKAKIVRKHRRPSAYFPGEYGVMFLREPKVG